MNKNNAARIVVGGIAIAVLLVVGVMNANRRSAAAKAMAEIEATDREVMAIMAQLGARTIAEGQAPEELVERLAAAKEKGAVLREAAAPLVGGSHGKALLAVAKISRLDQRDNEAYMRSVAAMRGVLDPRTIDSPDELDRRLAALRAHVDALDAEVLRWRGLPQAVRSTMRAEGMNGPEAEHWAAQFEVGATDRWALLLETRQNERLGCEMFVEVMGHLKEHWGEWSIGSPEPGVEKVVWSDDAPEEAKKLYRSLADKANEAMAKAGEGEMKLMGAQ